MNWKDEPSPSRESSEITGGQELTLSVEGEAPTALMLVVSWSDRESLSFRAPFPVEGCRFIARSGTELPSGLGRSASLSMNRMGGVVAEGRSHTTGAAFQIKAKLNAFDAKEGGTDWGTLDRDLTVMRDGVTHRLDLGAIRLAVCRLFSFSEDIAERQKPLRAFLFERMYRHHKVNRMMSQARRIVGDLFGLFLSEPETLRATAGV